MSILLLKFSQQTNLGLHKCINLQKSTKLNDRLVFHNKNKMNINSVITIRDKKQNRQDVSNKQSGSTLKEQSTLKFETHEREI